MFGVIHKGSPSQTVSAFKDFDSPPANRERRPPYVGAVAGAGAGAGRAKSGLGSSKGWGAATSCYGVCDGILSKNCTENPDFCDWNHVWVGYCGAHAGRPLRMLVPTPGAHAAASTACVPLPAFL